MYDSTIAALEKEIATEKALRVQAEEMLESLKRLDSVTSPFCSHNAQYSWSPDGKGISIVCLLCERERVTQQLTTCTLERERMRRALIRASEELDGDVPHQPQTCGLLGKPLCYIHEALTSTPSTIFEDMGRIVEMLRTSTCSNCGGQGWYPQMSTNGSGEEHEEQVQCQWCALKEQALSDASKYSFGKGGEE